MRRFMPVTLQSFLCESLFSAQHPSVERRWDKIIWNKLNWSSRLSGRGLRKYSHAVHTNAHDNNCDEFTGTYATEIGGYFQDLIKNQTHRQLASLQPIFYHFIYDVNFLGIAVPQPGTMYSELHERRTCCYSTLQSSPYIHLLLFFFFSFLHKLPMNLFPNISLDVIWNRRQIIWRKSGHL